MNLIRGGFIKRYIETIIDATIPICRPVIVPENSPEIAANMNRSKVASIGLLCAYFQRIIRKLNAVAIAAMIKKSIDFPN